jgi:hypothetical protein
MPRALNSIHFSGRSFQCVIRTRIATSYRKIACLNSILEHRSLDGPRRDDGVGFYRFARFEPRFGKVGQPVHPPAIVVG